MSKNRIFALFLGSIFFTAFDFQTLHAQMKIKTQDSVSYTQTPARGYLAEPASGKNLPALVMIHEWFGLGEDVKRVADKYAKLGYVVLAVDLYDGKIGKTNDEARALSTAAKNNPEPVLKNLKAAFDFLKAKKEVNPNRIGSLGWCFGGGWSYQMAKNNLGVKVSVIYYGQFQSDDDLKNVKSVILGHFAEKDATIQLEDVKKLEANLKQYPEKNHTLYTYPNTAHAFASREGNNPVYDATAAKLAWERTQEFLKKNL